MPREVTTGIYKALRALATRSVAMECDRIPFRFENVPLKKIVNWILVEASVYAKPERPWGWPTHLQIEPDARCNLRCVICPVTKGMGRPIGSMSLDMFRKLIDEAGDYVFLILLWDWGEPLLNPSLFEMISYARERGIKVICSTNAQLLAQNNRAEELVRSGLDTLIIAMDGISQETYQLYRETGSLEAVLEGVRSVVARKRELNAERPLINLRFLVMKHNEHEVPGLKELARSLGVDVLSLKTLNPYGPDSDLVPQNDSYRRFRYTNGGRTPLRRKHNPCKNLWNMPAIHWNGTVTPCTYDCDEHYVLGDLRSNSFENIWYGAECRRLRGKFRSDWESIPLCNQCSFAYEGGSCIDEIIAEAHFFNAAHP
ncbi:MAG: radical SAM protein [Anaerolineae bacterium]|nr:radical SAM protein [Anaerolineae bacterium]